MPAGWLFVVGFMLLSAPLLEAQQFSVTPRGLAGDQKHTYQLPAGILADSDKKAWTIELQLKLIPASGTFFAVADASGQVPIKGDTVGQSIEFQVTTDYRPEPLSVGLPLALIDQAKPHTFLLRYEGFRLALFCDGVLVDEEWPIGTIIGGRVARATLDSTATRLAVWNAVLSDAEIVTRYGGAAAVEARTDTILGKEAGQVEYGRPRGFNTNAGDAMPFFHDGTFHLFFLLDRRQHHSKWGLGAHQWGHIASTDLVHWTHYPPALSIDHEWEGSICTGSVYFDRGHYYAFYATRMPDRSEHLAMAESDDAVHFKKVLPTPFAVPSPPYLHGPNRDPFVFQQGNEFHMLVTAAIATEGDPKGHGALEHLVSNDLKTWTVLEKPFLIPDYPPQPECSELFPWRGWYYLTFGIDGRTHYRISRTPDGPWLKPRVDVLDGPEAFVMKAAAFKEDRMILVGFVQHDHHYGGDLVFRELVQEADGSLGTRFPAEMTPRGNSVTASSDIQLDAAHPTAPVKQAGTRVHVTAVLSSTKLSSPFGIKIAGSDSGAGEELLIDPASQRVAWVDAKGVATRATLEDVDGLKQPIALDLILEGTLVDVSINGHRTLIHRLDSIHSPHLEFRTKGTDLDISKIAVSSIP